MLAHDDDRSGKPTIIYLWVRNQQMALQTATLAGHAGAIKRFAAPLVSFRNTIITLDSNHSLGKAKRDVRQVYLTSWSELMMARCHDLAILFIAAKLPSLLRGLHCFLPFLCRSCLPPPLVYTATGLVIRLLVKHG